MSPARRWLGLDAALRIVLRPLGGLISSNFDKDNLRSIALVKEYPRHTMVAHAQPPALVSVGFSCHHRTCTR